MAEHRLLNTAFVSYWGLRDPLCTATVLPHLRIVREHHRVSSCTLLTFEREPFQSSPGDLQDHIPINLPIPVPPFSFLSHYLSAVWELLVLHRKKKLDLVICRSSFAGVLGHLMTSIFNVPYTVESFEPHADYMVDNGVWRQGEWKDLLLRYFESKVKGTAFRLFPVAENFRKSLVDCGVALAQLEVLPCTVDEHQFKFNLLARQRVRSCLGIPESAPTGIYVGKFGGMYLEGDEVVRVVRELFAGLPGGHLILLTDPASETCQLLRERVPDLVIHAQFVKPSEVCSFLSAADFGLVLTRPTKSSLHLSPIKIGEYLLCGLPVVSPPGIGDDSGWIRDEALGILFDPFSPCFQGFDPRSFDRNTIRECAIGYRGRGVSHRVLGQLIDDICVS